MDKSPPKIEISIPIEKEKYVPKLIFPSVPWIIAGLITDFDNEMGQSFFVSFAFQNSKKNAKKSCQKSNVFSHQKLITRYLKN